MLRWKHYSLKPVNAKWKISTGRRNLLNLAPLRASAGFTRLHHNILLLSSFRWHYGVCRLYVNQFNQNTSGDSAQYSKYTELIKRPPVATSIDSVISGWGCWNSREKLMIQTEILTESIRRRATPETPSRRFTHSSEVSTSASCDQQWHRPTLNLNQVLHKQSELELDQLLFRFRVPAAALRDVWGSVILLCGLFIFTLVQMIWRLNICIQVSHLFFIWQFLIRSGWDPWLGPGPPWSSEPLINLMCLLTLLCLKLLCSDSLTEAASQLTELLPADCGRNKTIQSLLVLQNLTLLEVHLKHMLTLFMCVSCFSLSFDFTVNKCWVQFRWQRQIFCSLSWAENRATRLIGRGNVMSQCCVHCSSHSRTNWDCTTR